MTGYYVVEEPDDVFPDDFGNDDAVKKQPQSPTGFMLTFLIPTPLPPTNLVLTLS